MNTSKPLLSSDEKFFEGVEKTALRAERATLRAENARLRAALAEIAREHNATGNAQIAGLKTIARAALAGGKE